MNKFSLMVKKIGGVHLIRGEEVINYSHPSFWTHFHYYLAGILPIYVSLHLYFFNMMSTNDLDELIIMASLGSLGFLWLLWTFMNNLSKVFIITNKRVVFREGILNLHIKEVDMDKIQNIRIQQSFLQRILNYGTLSIDTSGSEGYELILKGFGKIMKKQALIKHLMEHGLEAEKEHKKWVKTEKTLKDKKELLEQKKKEIKLLEKEIHAMDEHSEEYYKIEKELEKQVRKEEELLKKLREERLKHKK